MSNLINPTAIIFINSDIPTETINILQKQMNIDETVSLSEFNSRVNSNNLYPDLVHGQELRVLVLTNLVDSSNRNLADIVLSCRNGLIYVEKNKFGPPGKCLIISNVYLQALMH